METPKTTQSAPRFYVTHQGQVRGPFDLEMIEAMVLAGQFPAGVPVCMEGTEEWIPLASRSQPSPLPNKVTAKPKKNSGWDSPTNIILITVGGCVGMAVLIMGLVHLKNSGSRSSSSSVAAPASTSASSYYRKDQFERVPVVAAPTPPESDFDPSYTPPKSTYSSQNVSADSTLYRDAQGRTFRVPNSAYQRLLVKKSLLDIKQRAINSVKTEIDSLSAELDRIKLTLDRTSQYEIDLYNTKVNAYNTKNDRLQVQIDSFNAAVAAFNAELERVGTPIR